MIKVKERNFDDTFLNKEKSVLNEIAEENIIYDETQTGPQEEPYLFEYHVDVEKWRKYHRQKEERKNKFR